MDLTNDSRTLVNFYRTMINKKHNGKSLKFEISKDNIARLKSVLPVIKPKKKKSIKKNSNTKITHRSKKGEVRMYFNNIDTCSGERRLKNRDTMIKILKLLGGKYRPTLDRIYTKFNFSSQDRNKINIFLDSEMAKMTFDDCIEWVNLNGVELLRAIYMSFLDGILPMEINSLLGRFPHVKGQFTSLDIQNEIQLGLKKSRKLEIERGGIKLHLLVFGDKKIEISEKFLERCFYMDLLLNVRKDINLEIWLSNKKKNLPVGREVKYIGAKEVNSGCNTFSSKGNRVSIWRKEELPKVLIHELVHSLSLEKHHDYGEIVAFIYKHFDIKMDNNFNVFECYVELMAEIINIMLIGKGDNFNRLFNLEAHHCLFQVGKILNYFGYSSWDEFYRDGGWIENSKSGKYIQKSNVFSYFIFRSLIMFNMDDFMELCFNRNKKHFLKQEFASVMLLDIARKTLLDSNYSKIVNDYMKLNRTGSKKRLVFNNLRMTCLEDKL